MPAIGGTLFFDSDDLSHTFGGLGVQIWAGDASIQPLLRALRIRYVRLEAFPNWASVWQDPPADGLRSSFDQYVRAWYGSSRLANMLDTSAMLDQLGIQQVFIQFHYPSAWRTAAGSLRTENHQDVALLWGAQLAYLQSHGVEPDFVELFNEPEGTWNCRVPPDQYKDVLQRVRQELDDRGLGAVRIVGPGLACLDHDSGGTLWVGALDETAVASLGGFSTHAWDEVFSQGCGPAYLRQRWQPFFTAVRSKDPFGQKPVFVTEYMTANHFFHGVEYPPPGSNYAFSASDTVPFAIRVFEHTLSLLNGGASVPILWEASDQSWSDSGWGLQRRTADGSVRRPTYYAMKAFADLVPSGSWVLAAPPQDEEDIYCAAFKQEGGVVLAAVNGTSEVRTKTVVIRSSDPMDFVHAVSYAAHETGAGEGMFVVPGPNQIDLTLPADSVLTVAFEFSASAPEKVLEWKFEGNLEDTSGNENHVTAAEGGFGYARGQCGQAISLDGRDVLIEMTRGTNLPLHAADDWSMNLWVFAEDEISYGPDYHALALAVMGTNSWSENGNARSIGNWGWGGGISFYSTTMVPTASHVPYDAGRWQMITLTYDHSLWQEQGTDTTGQALKVYKDGTPIASFDPQGRYYTGGFKEADNRVSLLPVIPDQAPERFVGRLDEFTIWRGVLLPARIQQMASQVPVAGDLSGDRRVDLEDFLVFCGFWLSQEGDSVANFNADDVVDLMDFAVLAESFEVIQ